MGSSMLLMNKFLRPFCASSAALVQLQLCRPRDGRDSHNLRRPDSPHSFSEFGIAKSWRNLFLGGARHYSASNAPQLSDEEIENIGSGPCLMFADEKNDDTEKKGGEIRRCYSFSSGKSFILRAPQLQGRRCWGTQYGWLITLGLDRQMHLFNPLTQQQLSLPSQLSFEFPEEERDWFVNPDVMIRIFIQKFSLSSNPSDSTPIITSIFGAYHLALASPGDRAWKSLHFKSNESINNTAVIWDVIYYNEQFFYLNSHFELRCCGIDCSRPYDYQLSTFPTTIFTTKWDVKFYLVDISGELHLVKRQFRIKDLKTESFDVYRFDFGNYEWIEVSDLKNQAVYVGNNASFSVSKDDHPGIIANGIYFGDDHFSDFHLKKTGMDMGIYDHACRYFYQNFFEDESDSLSNFSRPFFFMPSPSNKNTN